MLLESVVHVELYSTFILSIIKKQWHMLHKCLYKVEWKVVEAHPEVTIDFPLKSRLLPKDFDPLFFCYIHTIEFENKAVLISIRIIMDEDQEQDERPCKSCCVLFRCTDKFWDYLGREPCRSKVLPDDPAIVTVRENMGKWKVPPRWTQVSHRTTVDAQKESLVDKCWGWFSIIARLVFA